MKRRSLPYRPLTVWLVLLLLIIQPVLNDVNAQMPDCLTNTYMYGLFSPKNTTFPTSGLDSIEIRQIRFSDASVGILMGGRRYFIRKRPAQGSCPTCPLYYGSSAMGLEPLTGRFYLITQMGSGGSGSSTAYGDKDIVMIDPLAPTATGTVVGTINDLADGAGGPTNMDNYHFVKAAVAPNGFGYAIGVHRDGSSASSTFNPIVRFSLCPTAGCSNMILLGYISNDDPVARGMNLFNGDITFDRWGNLYFFASALSTATNRYTDSRLFRINAANMPTSAGTGEIPISFLADYDNLDTTGASGVVTDAGGNIYMTLRNYNYAVGPNEYTTELWRSTNITSASIMPGFGPIHDSLSAGDLAACYFTAALLPGHDTKLTAKYSGNASVKLKWEVDDNSQVSHFEIQSSPDGENFTTIATVYPTNTGQDKFAYSYSDERVSGNAKHYRVRKVLQSGSFRYYSNVVKVAVEQRLNVISKASPNPFVESISFQVELKSPQSVQVRLIDQSGRVVISRNFNAKPGTNSIKLDGIGGIKNGIYIMEISAENEVVREKLIKQ